MATKRPLVRSATLNGYLGLARSLQLDGPRLMHRVGLDPANLAVPDKWIPAADVARLLHISAKASGRPDFAVRLAEQRRLSTLKGEGNYRNVLRCDVLADIGFKQVIGHRPVRGGVVRRLFRVKLFLFEIEAVLAIEIADRTDRLGQNMEGGKHAVSG